jgi:hypothetical protein
MIEVMFNLVGKFIVGYGIFRLIEYYFIQRKKEDKK